MSSKTFQLRVREGDTFFDLIDEWRRLQKPIPAKAEAIRLLAKRGLALEIAIDAEMMRRVREEAGLSQDQLGDAVGLARDRIALMESGRLAIGAKTMEAAEALIDALERKLAKVAEPDPAVEIVKRRVAKVAQGEDPDAP